MITLEKIVHSETNAPEAYVNIRVGVDGEKTWKKGLYGYQVYYKQGYYDKQELKPTDDLTTPYQFYVDTVQKTSGANDTIRAIKITPNMVFKAPGIANPEKAYVGARVGYLTVTGTYGFTMVDSVPNPAVVVDMLGNENATDSLSRKILFMFDIIV